MMTVGIPKVYTRTLFIDTEMLIIEYEALHGHKPSYWIISKSTRIEIWKATKNIMCRRFSDDEVPKLDEFLGIRVLELEERVTWRFMQLV